MTIRINSYAADRISYQCLMILRIPYTYLIRIFRDDPLSYSLLSIVYFFGKPMRAMCAEWQLLYQKQPAILSCQCLLLCRIKFLYRIFSSKYRKNLITQFMKNVIFQVCLLFEINQHLSFYRSFARQLCYLLVKPR